MVFFGVNLILQKFCQCKKNDKYQVCSCWCHVTDLWHSCYRQIFWCRQSAKSHELFSSSTPPTPSPHTHIQLIIGILDAICCNKVLLCQKLFWSQMTAPLFSTNIRCCCFPVSKQANNKLSLLAMTLYPSPQRGPTSQCVRGKMIENSCGVGRAYFAIMSVGDSKASWAGKLVCLH